MSFENILKNVIKLNERVSKLEEKIKAIEGAISWLREYGNK